jgi:hypothetical protein
MFGKKKLTVLKNPGYQCQVPGCGLSCGDESTLKRHMDWAHSTKTDSVKDSADSGLQLTEKKY